MPTIMRKKQTASPPNPVTPPREPTSLQEMRTRYQFLIEWKDSMGFNNHQELTVKFG